IRCFRPMAPRSRCDRHRAAEQSSPSRSRAPIARHSRRGRNLRRRPRWPLLRQVELMANILVCDDTRSICEMLEIALRKNGQRVETVTSGDAARRKLDSAIYDVVVTDIKMPHTDGIEVLHHTRRVSPDTAVILITAVEDYDAAVEAVNAGAFQYIHKGPGLVEEVRIAVTRAVESLGLRRQNVALKRDAATRNSLDNIIGTSPAIRKLKETIRTVAP